MKEKEYQFKGNKEILNTYKVAFFCSKRCPSYLILKSYDWAIEQRNKGICVICGFDSKIDNDIFNFLVRGKQPIIEVLARSMKKRFSQQEKELLTAGRLLIISPFSEKYKRKNAKLAAKRNEVIYDLADEIMIAYANQGGLLEEMLYKKTGKVVKWLDNFEF